MSAPVAASWRTWNRSFHIYLGLYFLVFLWLLALSGLLLNHAWRFTEFWSQRQESGTEHAIHPPRATEDLGQARELMAQLGLAGEIESTTIDPRAEQFTFRVVRPGRIVDVTANWRTSLATVRETKVNAWGAIRMLHTFSGKKAGATQGERDWAWTRLWSLAMDALAVGLIVLVAGSVILASESRERWLGSVTALALGLAASAFFVFGLRWL